jgi:hypothetical protein
MFRRPGQLVDDLFPVDTNVALRLDPKSHLIATHVKHGDRDVTIDAQRLTNLTSENEHMSTSDGNQYIADNVSPITVSISHAIAKIRNGEIDR